MRRAVLHNSTSLERRSLYRLQTRLLRIDSIEPEYIAKLSPRRIREGETAWLSSERATTMRSHKLLSQIRQKVAASRVKLIQQGILIPEYMANKQDIKNAD